MNDRKKRIEALAPDEKKLVHAYLFLIVLLILCAVVSYVQPYESGGLNSRSFITLSDGWVRVFTDGWERHIAKLPADLHAETGEEVVIRRTLPEQFPVKSPVLFVRSTHQNVIAWVNGEEIYRYSFQPTRWYNEDSAPILWLTIPMEEAYAGQELELSLTRLRDERLDTVSSIYLGDKTDIIFHLARRSAFPLICSGVLLMMGLLFLVRQMLSPTRRKLGNRNLYIGMLLVLLPLWTFANSDVRQLFFQNVLYAQNLEYVTLMMTPVPAILSVNDSEGGKYKKAAHALCALIIAADLAVLLLSLAAVRSLLSMLWVIMLTLVAAAVFVLASLWSIAFSDPELFRELRIVQFSYGMLALFGFAEYMHILFFGDLYKGICLALGMLCYSAGLTIEQSRTQRKLVAQAQHSEMASRAKSEFLANVSHEIRTPINAVLGMDEMILREAKDPAVLSYAADIRRAGKHLLTLINDILDLSRIESGRMELSEYDYDLPMLLEDVTELTRVSAEEKGLKFQVKIQSVMPVKLHGDAARIRQIAINLLNNAVKYTKRGRVVFTVDTISAEEADVLREKAAVKGEPTQLESPLYLRMTVRDTGIGIRKEDMNKLFDSFERLDPKQNASVQGTGLGLPIVSMLVQLMGGCLLVNSVYEIGTQFTVVIPQATVAGEGYSTFKRLIRDTDDAQADRAGFLAPEAEVLAVDDNAINRRLIEALLRRTQVRLTTCESGEKCLELVRERHFDLILMDHLMPEMDGIQTLHAMRDMPNRCAGVPVIVLTANAVTGAKEGYLSEGFTDYLSKPIQSAELERMMMRYLPPEKLRPAEPDAEPSAPPETDDLPDWLHRVEEIDVGQGLGFCSTAETYLETMTIYAKNAAASADEIEAYYRADDLANTVVKVHALKSTSRAIGAEALGALAEKLELAGKAGDIQTVEAGLDELLSRCRALGEALSPLLETEPAAEESSLPQISEERLRETYAAIRALAGEFEYDRAASMIESLSGMRVPEGERERCDALARAAENFDWDQIGEILA